MFDSRLVPAPVLARRLQVKVSWVRAEAAANRLPHVKADAQYLFDYDVVERVLLQRAAVLPGAEPREAARA